MVDEENPSGGEPKKGSKKPMIIGLILALLLGGGGFFAVYSGMILAPPVAQEEIAEDMAAPLPDVAFVEVDPLIINLGRGATGQHLRFRAQVEVGPDYAAEVATLMPRIVDVLNAYLRAVDMRDLEDPAALIRLRSQMLRRVQVVAGEGRVRDLLIMEFVLS